MSDDDPEVVAVARDWLRKADGDWTAARLLLEGGGPAWTVCFHAQQEAERLLMHADRVREFVRSVLPRELLEP